MVEFKAVKKLGECEECGGENVEVNEDGICRDCFQALLDDPKLGLLVELELINSQEACDCTVSENEYYDFGFNYLVLTEDEVQEKAKEYIEENVWSFRSSFLAGETNLDEKIFQCLSGEYENSNEAIKSLIEATCGMDEFVKSAVGADGYEAYLDDERNSIEEYYEYDGEHYYVYE